MLWFLTCETCSDDSRDFLERANSTLELDVVPLQAQVQHAKAPWATKHRFIAQEFWWHVWVDSYIVDSSFVCSFFWVLLFWLLSSCTSHCLHTVTMIMIMIIVIITISTMVIVMAILSIYTMPVVYDLLLGHLKGNIWFLFVSFFGSKQMHFPAFVFTHKSAQTKNQSTQVPAGDEYISIFHQQCFYLNIKDSCPTVATNAIPCGCLHTFSAAAFNQSFCSVLAKHKSSHFRNDIDAYVLYCIMSSMLLPQVSIAF